MQDKTDWRAMPAEVTEGMIDAAFRTEEMQAVEECVKIAYNLGYQPFKHSGWRDCPLAVAYAAMVRAVRDGQQ